MNDMDGKHLLSELHREDGQVWSWLLKIFLVALVIGFIITQFGPIILNQISIHGTADDAVDEAAIEYLHTRGDMEKVNRVVNDLLESRDTRLVTNIAVVKGQSGEPDMITVSVRKIVNSFLFENVGYLCRYTEAKAFSERPLR